MPRLARYNIFVCNGSVRIHIHSMATFNCALPSPVPPQALISFPYLPALKSVDLELYLADTISQLFMDTASAILTSDVSPALGEITITAVPVRSTPYLLNQDVLTALDKRVAAHPALPYIRWRVDFQVDDRAQRMHNFVVATERGMPESNQNGRVIIEEYAWQRLYFKGLPIEAES
jgi:hypothetical protein